MDVTLFNIIIASLVISLISLSGAILFVAKEKRISKYMILFVALAAGSLLGNAFFHLIPETVHLSEDLEVHSEDDEHVEHEHAHEEHSEIFLPSYFMLLGILLFYIIEKFIHWHHHHDLNCHKHSLSTLSIIGDGFHNFIDGVLIAVAFIANPALGIATTIAIALHEIPQEIGDLAILLHSGMSKVKALFFNFLSALMSLIGAVATYFFVSGTQGLLPYLIALTAGSFIYIALADIVPELHDSKTSKLSITLFFFIGLVLMYALTTQVIH